MPRWLCCGACYRRGILWVLGIVVSGIGTLIFLVTAIARPDETISWLYAATYAIEGLALLGLGLTPRQDLAAGVAVGDSGVAHEPKETLGATSRTMFKDRRYDSRVIRIESANACGHPYTLQIRSQFRIRQWLSAGPPGR
jgi:hypothetical protein